jgi:hypothetical protein
MVINSTKINKTNKSPLNSDGHQFYQNQQNKQSPLNSDGHQFYQNQQNKESLNSDGHQSLFRGDLFVLLILVELMTITV